MSAVIGLVVVILVSILGISVFAFLWIQKTKQLKKLEEDQHSAGLSKEIIQKIKDYSGGINGLLKNAEEIQELEKYKKFGTPKDFESFKQLKDDCLLIGLTRSLIVDLRNEEITVPSIMSEQKRLESKLKQKDQKLFDLEKKIVIKDQDLYLRDSEIERLKGEKRSVIEELEKRDHELSNGGFTDFLKNELINRKFKTIPFLLSKFEELEEKLERGQKLANNDPLEVAEEKYRKSRENVEKIRGFSRNIRETGVKFENGFYEGFKSVFGTCNSEVKCSSQDNGSDFVIFFDSENSSCKIVVECKSILDDESDLYSLSFSEEDTEKKSKQKKEQLEAGIKQIKKYLKNHDAQIGILLTSFDFEKEYEEIRKDSKNDIDFPLFVVKNEVVFQFLSLIYFVNKYSVPVEKPTIDIESFKDKEYEFIPFVKEVFVHVKELQKHHNKTLKKAQEVYKHAGLFNQYSGRLKEDLDRFVSYVDRKKGFIDFGEGQETLSLDSSVEVLKEEIEEDEEIEESDLEKIQSEVD